MAACRWTQLKYTDAVTVAVTSKVQGAGGQHKHTRTRDALLCVGGGRETWLGVPHTCSMSLHSQKQGCPVPRRHEQWRATTAVLSMPPCT